MTLPDAFLPTLRSRLEALYGARLARVVLFGSYARGEATPESDVDVLVVLRGEVSVSDDADALADIDLDLQAAHGLVTSLLVIGEATDSQDWPLLRNVHADGITLDA